MLIIIDYNTLDHTIDVKFPIGGFTTECFNEYLVPGKVFHMIFQVKYSKI